MAIKKKKKFNFASYLNNNIKGGGKWHILLFYFPRTLFTYILTFMTHVFPQAIETGNIHNGIMAGKLNGTIPPVTPRGVRYE